jgi:hypothetical protein
MLFASTLSTFTPFPVPDRVANDYAGNHSRKQTPGSTGLFLSVLLGDGTNCITGSVPRDKTQQATKGQNYEHSSLELGNVFQHV